MGRFTQSLSVPRASALEKLPPEGPHHHIATASAGAYEDRPRHKGVSSNIAYGAKDRRRQVRHHPGFGLLLSVSLPVVVAFFGDGFRRRVGLSAPRLTPTPS